MNEWWVQGQALILQTGSSGDPRGITLSLSSPISRFPDNWASVSVSFLLLGSQKGKSREREKGRGRRRSGSAGSRRKERRGRRRGGTGRRKRGGAGGGPLAGAPRGGPALPGRRPAGRGWGRRRGGAGGAGPAEEGAALSGREAAPVETGRRWSRRSPAFWTRFCREGGGGGDEEGVALAGRLTPSGPKGRAARPCAVSLLCCPERESGIWCPCPSLFSSPQTRAIASCFSKEGQQQWLHLEACKDRGV